MRRGIALAAVAVLLGIVACVTEDTENPVVSIVVPVNGDTLTKGDIVIKTVATDNKSVTKVEFFVDGSLVGTDNVGGTADTFRYTWSDTAAQTSGAHTLGAKAYDAAENTGSATTLDIYISGEGGGTGPTYHEGMVDEDETWWPSGNPHILEHDVFTGENVTLTIKPGCVVKFNSDVELYTGYTNPGAIVAVGTADSTILFTSNIPTPSPGDWMEVGVFEHAMSTTSFEYCTFEYGGGASSYGSFYVDDVDPRMMNCTVRKSSGVGIKVNGTGSFREFSGNTVTECESYPLEIMAEYVRTLGTGNDFTGNTKDGVLIQGGAVTTTGTWLNHTVPYVIAHDVNIGDDNNNPVLTIAPGTTVQLQSDVEFYVGYSQPGGLIIDGTDSQITFTSSIDPPSPGDWYSIGFYEHCIDQHCKLINSKVEYGGGDYANVRIWNAVPEVRGDSIGHSGKWGIYLSGSEYPVPDTLLANNTFYDNADGDVGP